MTVGRRKSGELMTQDTIALNSFPYLEVQIHLGKMSLFGKPNSVHARLAARAAWSAIVQRAKVSHRYTRNKLGTPHR